MTHGCIKITTASKKGHILLHTYHTGMMIPEIVAKAPAFWIDHRFEFLLEQKGRKMEFLFKDKEALAGLLCRQAFYDGVFWPPTIAGMLISQHPYLLEPFPSSFMSKIPCCSSQEAPWLLRAYETDRVWELEDEEHKVTKFKPLQMMIDHLWERYYERAKRDPRA